MDNALELSNIEKAFGGLKVTRGVNLQVAQGERRLIIGPNGAGKTTLFNLIAGQLRPDRGSIRIFGSDVTDRPSRDRPQLGVARTFQIITLFPEITIRENVVIAMLGLLATRWNPLSRLGRNRQLFAKADEALDRVGMKEAGDRLLGQTNYGDQRRVEIALALAQEPRLLLLDEPYAGLSASERVQVRELLASIPRDVTVLMIEHDMDVALEFADRVTLLHFGVVEVEGSRVEVASHPRTRELYLGA